MYLISYREIFDELMGYFKDPKNPPPSIKEVAVMIRELYNELFDDAEGRFKAIVWDEKKQLDSRSVEDFKRDLGIADNQKMYYVTENGTITNIWGTDPYTGYPLLTADECRLSMSTYLDDKIKWYMQNRMVTIILDKLIDKELNNGG
jgi:hypothetical protein